MSDHTHDDAAGWADLPCIELVELVTDYLDDALTDDVRARVDAHLPYCDGCSTVMNQFRELIHLSGRLTEADVEEVDPESRQRLLATFRQSRQR